MKRAREHDNNNRIVHFYGMEIVDKLLVFENLKESLLDLFNRDEKGISIVLVKKYGRQMLQGLQALSASQIVHCDLKLDNIMLTEKGNLKIIDLGNSRLLEAGAFTTDYPNITMYWAVNWVSLIFWVIGLISFFPVMELPFSFSIDIFAVGIILFQLNTNKNYLAMHPIPNDDSSNGRLYRMMQIRGKIPEEMIKNAKGKKYFEKSDDGKYKFLYEVSLLN